MVKSFIPWYGGKARMCKDILCFIPNNKIHIFVEVFGGGMRVLLNKPFSTIEIYNDLDEGLVSLFRCMQDLDIAKQLQKKLLEIPYSLESFEMALNHHNDPNLDDVSRAMYKFILITQSFNSACKSFRKPKTRDIISTYHKRIINMLSFVQRIKRMKIENMDFEDLINKYDSPNTFFYLDPPYVLDTRGAKSVYKHEADDNLHKRMVDTLLDIEGMALVSGYDHSLYDRISHSNWKKYKLGEYAKSSQIKSLGSTKSKGIEYIWKNY